MSHERRDGATLREESERRSYFFALGLLGFALWCLVALARELVMRARDTRFRRRQRRPARQTYAALDRAYRADIERQARQARPRNTRP
jgi:hypothetical protein